MRTRLVILVLLLPGAATLPAAPHQRVDRATVAPFEVDVPLSDERLISVLLRMAGETRSPLGIESLPPVYAGERVFKKHPRSPVSVEVGGEPVDRSVATLTELNGHFAAIRRGGIINVIPKVISGRTILDRRVQATALDHVTISEALQAVHKLFNPDYVSGGTAGSLPMRPDADVTEEMARVRRVTEKRFSVVWPEGTVRDALNAIVLAHGELSWVVSYTAEPLAYENSAFTAVSFDGGRTTLTPMRHR